MIAPDLVRRLRDEGLDVAEGDDPALVAKQLQPRIIRLVTSERDLLSRPRYDRLMALWSALTAAAVRRPHECSHP